MKFPRVFASAVFLIAASYILTSTVILAQAPSIPPDIQAIMDKASRGQLPTAAEVKKLQQWSESMSKQAAGAAPASSGNNAGSTPSAGAGGSKGGAANSSTMRSPVRNGTSPGPAQHSAVAASGTSTPCPPARALSVATKAPGPDEYLKLVQSLVDSHGKRLGADRSSLDGVLGRANSPESASEIGSVLLLSGDASASVYASAVAASQHPTDALIANNLGVALDHASDSNSAIQVLMYIRQLQPQLALPAINLGWAYFNSGNSALAQKQFEDASRLGPNLAGPDAGLGLLATCRGDNVTALRYLRSSLSKSYSGAVAIGYQNAQAAQDQGGGMFDGESQAEDQSGGFDSSPLPELPVYETPEMTEGAEASLHQQSEFADKRVQELVNKLNSLHSRLLDLSRRAQIDPEGAIDFPRVFDKQIFEFGEIARGTFAPAVKSAAPQLEQMGKVISSTGEQTLGQASVDMQKTLELQQKQLDLMNQDLACIQSGADDDKVCKPRYQPQIDALDRQMQEIAYRVCKLNRSLKR